MNANVCFKYPGVCLKVLVIVIYLSKVSLIVNKIPTKQMAAVPSLPPHPASYAKIAEANIELKEKQQ